MELTAKLVSPKRLNYKGVLWKRGETVPIDFDTAIELSKNARFYVEGLPGTSSDPKRRAMKPANKLSNTKIIANTIEQFDPDDNSLYDRTGEPSCAALALRLGYEVTEEERDAAVRYNATKEDVEPETPPAKKPRVRFTSSKSGAKDKALEALDSGKPLRGPSELKAPPPADDDIVPDEDDDAPSI